ncbi:DUF202 domain-containing protein, partial [Arthrobacter deserti]|nr:DUF202 domain-containing protein [Arthrobacter deserti]
MPGPGNSGGAPRHTDAGLQPERTALAWTRTTLALVVASVFFLRWMPSHGWFTATLIIVTAGTALAINL